MDEYHRLKNFNSGLLTNLVAGLVVLDKPITDKQRNEADTVGFNNGYDALLFEKSLHKKYKSRRLDPKFMESYHTFNGHTECYSLDVKDELLEEISLKESQFV